MHIMKAKWNAVNIIRSA